MLITRHSLAGLMGLALILAGPGLIAPVCAQTLDDVLASGQLPDDARAAPGAMALGPVLTAALQEASAGTLMDNREHGFCIAREDGRIGVFSYALGSAMGISLKCMYNGEKAAGELHTHPSFSAGIPSTEDFGGLNPKQAVFVVAHPQDGEATAILLTQKALDRKTLGNARAIASASAVIRVMVQEFMQGARPAKPDKQYDADFADLYVSAVCEKLSLVCYHRANYSLSFARLGNIDDVISAKFNPDEQRRGRMGVQFLLDWLGGKAFALPDMAQPGAITSMSAALERLDSLAANWSGAVIFTSPHIITNVRFPSEAGSAFVGLAIPPEGDEKIVETGGRDLRTFSATEGAFDPEARISNCIRVGEDVTIDGGRYNDALFGDISSGTFQHHCFSLRAGSALQLTATEIVSDGYMTTILDSGGHKPVKTLLADFCPPDKTRGGPRAIVFCSRNPSFSVP